MRLQKIKR